MIGPLYLAEAINARIESTDQTVVRGPNLMGLGYLPDFTPAQNDDLLTGRIGGIGGLALGLPTI